MSINLQEVHQRFWEDGFVVVRSVFNAEEIAKLTRELDGLLASSALVKSGTDVYFEDTPGKPIKSAFRLEKHSAYFRDLLSRGPQVEVIRAVLEGEPIPTIGVAFFAKPARDGSVTPGHQDNGFQHWSPPIALTVTIAVDRSTPENGALTCHRGSHRLGLLKHRPSGVPGFSQRLEKDIDESMFPPVRLCMEPGDISLHHIDVVHGSGANRSDRSRRQIGITYRSPAAQRDEAAFASYMAELKRLLEKVKT